MPTMRVITCEVDGCDNDAPYGHLKCRMHAQRLRRHGTVADPKDRTESRPKRTCDIGGCPRPHHGHGFCATHLYQIRRESPGLLGKGASAANEARLDAAPLLAVIEARGGIHSALDIAGVRKDTTRESLQTLYHRARKRGYLPISSADRLAIEALEMHPYEIYGEDWWTGLPEMEAVA